MKVVRAVATKKFRLRMGLCLLLLAICYGGYLKVRSLLNPFDDLPFSSQRWATSNEEQRTQMTQDLVRKYLKKGTTRAKVTALLGKPDSIGYNAIHYENETEEESRTAKKMEVYIYNLGASGDVPYHMDGMQLCIYFDKVNTLFRAFVSQT